AFEEQSGVEREAAACQRGHIVLVAIELVADVAGADPWSNEAPLILQRQAEPGIEVQSLPGKKVLMIETIPFAAELRGPLVRQRQVIVRKLHLRQTSVGTRFRLNRFIDDLVVAQARGEGPRFP